MFQCHINLRWLFNAKDILVESQQWYYLTHSRNYKEFDTFLKGISPKENAISQLGFELAYLGVAVHHISNNATGTFRKQRSVKSVTLLRISVDTIHK